MSSDQTAAAAGVELVRRSFQIFNRGDLEACADLLSPEFVANIPGAPGPLHGRDAWKQNALMFRQAFPDLTAVIDDIFASDDRVAVRLTFRGTHSGPFLGIEATHRQVTFTSIEIYRLSGDQIAEEWVAPDTNTLMTQINGRHG